MGSGFSRKFCTSFHDWGQVFMFEGKSYPLGRAFTNSIESAGGKLAQSSDKSNRMIDILAQ
jgi:hypothetical protein